MLIRFPRPHLLSTTLPFLSSKKGQLICHRSQKIFVGREGCHLLPDFRPHQTAALLPDPPHDHQAGTSHPPVAVQSPTTVRNQNISRHVKAYVALKSDHFSTHTSVLFYIRPPEYYYYINNNIDINIHIKQ